MHRSPSSDEAAAVRQLPPLALRAAGIVLEYVEINVKIAQSRREFKLSR
jgi:hypothetical protein